MFSSLVVFIPFSETEINHIYCLNFLPFANHEIVSLDIAMDETFAMNLFQAGDYLNADINCGGQAELFLA